MKTYTLNFSCDLDKFINIPMTMMPWKWSTVFAQPNAQVTLKIPDGLYSVVFRKQWMYFMPQSTHQDHDEFLTLQKKICILRMFWGRTGDFCFSP